MSRLFVAINLPALVSAKLARLQPSPCAGLKLISMTQMHLTLHFIGEAAISPVIDALQTVRAQPFLFRLAGLGQFRVNGGVTLWAGVDVNEALLALRMAVGLALSSLRFRPEARRYTPHVTLARCKPAVPAQVISQFMASSAMLDLPEVAVAGFALYSSTMSSEGSQYSCEQWFPLHCGR